MGRSSLGLIALLCLAASPACAQRPVAVGDTVHVTLTDGGPALRGRVAAFRVDAITLRLGPGDEREIFTSLIHTINRLDGRKRATSRGAQVGLLGGLLVGVGLSAADALSNGASKFRAGQIPVRLLIGGMGGTLVGVAVGAGFETNRWVPSGVAVADQGVELRYVVGIRIPR